MRLLLLFLISFSIPASAQTWHANSNGWPVTITLAQQNDKLIGYMAAGENDCSRQLDSVTWENNSLEFRLSADGITQWYRVNMEDGVMIGRFAHLTGLKQPKPELLAYRYHVTGWNEDALPITPAVFDLNKNGYHARLRIDKSGDSFTGRLKVYGFENQTLEGPEEEIVVNHWDGEKIAFTRANQVYTGEARGRYVSGVFTHNGQDYPWSGRRHEVLTYGLTARSDRTAWQERVRRILYRLMMAGNPEPSSRAVEIIRSDIPPIGGHLYPFRDDDPASHPQNYTLTEFRLNYAVPTQFGAAARTVHGYLAKPNGQGPYPLVVAVNGHFGSAHQVMDGSTLFWYGDAWARRGYAVLTVDIGHRPDSDVVRARSTADLSTYLGYPDVSYRGDDVANGNGLRPSIKAVDDPYYTDFEEDGERVWDVLKSLDWVLERDDIDRNKIVVTGLSMGGEIASYVGALDPRIRAIIPVSATASDLSVLKYLRRVGHCVNWSFADIREYIDYSDIWALSAPRLLIVQTGVADRAYSESSTPFSGDKQAVRRARVAGGPLFHLLHPLGHEYRAGVVTHTVNDLQTDVSTTSDGRTLFDYVADFLR